MPKPDGKMSPRSWAKPEVRRIVGGAAEFGGAAAADGSGISS
ncbi:MAG TPA: hypothetical protein VF574_06245 [Allosphingosinicella sp.]|jgi:hypothetical protein